MSETKNVETSPVERLVMPSATGFVTWDVAVTCPHCGKKLALNQYPYDNNETEYCPAEDELGIALFGKVDEPAKWQGFDIAYECCGCKGSFSLTSLEI